jgi:NADPH-dependent 2,4-dienoyl-CoA reductase/sulfur reductase-like enzyme
MIEHHHVDIAVIGGGPAGMSAALKAHEAGAKVLLLDREERLGGILKQCIHDGFGLIRFGEQLSGPEYAARFLEMIYSSNISYRTRTFISDINKTETGFTLVCSNPQGMFQVMAKAVIFATGCRERTARQVAIHGDRCAGVFTAGCAQHFVNLQGRLPGRRCVILGSGDIGLIMARRLTLEGAEVLGVYEAKPTPSGLQRNIHQCLMDWNIPLYLGATVVKCFGRGRLEAVEVAKVDKNMKPIPGTEKRIECDTLIVSVGLIPENELAENLGVEMDTRTKGPVCDQDCMTSVPGVYCCGNALHVSDLVDYVSENAEIAGKAAARRVLQGSVLDTRENSVEIRTDGNLLYTSPQRITPPCEKAVLFFRSKQVLKNATLTIRRNGRTLLEKKYQVVRPPEMERLELNVPDEPGTGLISCSLEGTPDET